MSFSHVRQFSSSIANFDHYRILGVRRNASSKEIKAAFYHLSLIFHPDMQPKKTKMNRANSYNAAISLEEYQRISAAYSVLSDSEKRKAYDRKRAASLTAFDKWRDEFEEWRYRRYYRKRLAEEGKSKGGEGGGEDESEEEEDRRRRAADPPAWELMLGARKTSARLLFLCLFIPGYVFFDRIMRGNLFK